MRVPPSRPAGGLVQRGLWLWRWFWFIFTKNRVVVAAASLMWLVWRSGAQPRRLAYPCQQAAAANLGFLAVLFVPALARRRRRSLGSVLPRAAELATGSVLLGGVLFILVSAGVEVYSEINAAWSPGSPAVVSWTVVQPSSAAALSPRVPVLSNSESVVAVNRNPSVTYGTQPYGPGTNSGYELVWQTVADLHLGPQNNPLQDLVADMNGDGVIRVLIKPNTVEYFDANSSGERNPAYVHPAMIRPVVDMLCTAGANQVYVGDGPENGGGYLVNKLDRMGYTQAYFSQMAALWPGRTIARVDFHTPRRFSWVNLGTTAGGPSAYAGSGYTSSSLSKYADGNASAYFSAVDSHGQAGPGKSNCMGTLAISDELLDADVIVDLAKLKVHYLVVSTAVLKNWVGITMYSTFNGSAIGGCRVAHSASGSISNYEREWGNDILWREIVDAHRSVLYWRNGAVQPTLQRRYLCLLDAIDCGEKYHVPSTPWHYWLHTIAASVDPVAIDAVGTRLQRYEFRRIPLVNNAHAASISSPWPLGTADPGKLRVVGGTDVDGIYNHVFAWETAQDSTMSWPDWMQTQINDMQPPAIQSAHIQDLGGGNWQVAAEIADAYVAYYYYGDDGAGAPNVLRLARNGNTYSATFSGAAGNGVLIAQDDHFNTSRITISNAPAIELSTRTLTLAVNCRQGAANDTFTVRNAGLGELTYTVSANADGSEWLSVSPLAGSSTGEADTVTVGYNLAQLAPGSYTGTITVADPNAVIPQQSIAVSVTVTGFDADFNGDLDVDQEDFAHLQVCLTGDQVAQTDAACADTRLDGDLDVDVADAAVFLSCLSGSGVPASACCVR